MTAPSILNRTYCAYITNWVGPSFNMDTYNTYGRIDSFYKRK
jgi:hypothetical protein